MPFCYWTPIYLFSIREYYEQKNGISLWVKWLPLPGFWSIEKREYIPSLSMTVMSQVVKISLTPDSGKIEFFDGLVLTIFLLCFFSRNASSCPRDDLHDQLRLHPLLRHTGGGKAAQGLLRMETHQKAPRAAGTIRQGEKIGDCALRINHHQTNLIRFFGHPKL